MIDFCNWNQRRVKSDFLRANHHWNILLPRYYDLTPSRRHHATLRSCLFPLKILSSIRTYRNDGILQLQQNIWLSQGQSSLEHFLQWYYDLTQSREHHTLLWPCLVQLIMQTAPFLPHKKADGLCPHLSYQTSSRASTSATSFNHDGMILDNPGDNMPRCDHVWFNL